MTIQADSFNEAPTGENAISSAPIAFFSSGSGNTARLASRLDISSARIPARESAPRLVMTRPFVLITPSFADAFGHGAIPKPVLRFLDDPRNEQLLRGVIGSGNRNFGDMFALGGRRVAEKCEVPLLYRFELSGTSADVDAINTGVSRFLQLSTQAA